MKNSKIPTLIIIFSMVLVSACENETCPEGSIPITDSQGFVIDCTDTFDSRELNTVPLE